jgi:hypothetical protein
MRDLEASCMKQAHEDGLSTTDRYGQRRPHPLLSVARDARGQSRAQAPKRSQKAS